MKIYPNCSRLPCSPLPDGWQACLWEAGILNSATQRLVYEKLSSEKIVNLCKLVVISG